MALSSTDLMRMIFEKFMMDHEIYSITGKVVAGSINTNTHICQVKPDNGDPIIQRVKYTQTNGTAQGMIATPKDNSQVTVTFLNTNFAIITDVQEFEEIVYDAGTDSVTAVQALTDKLNDLISEVEALRDDYLLHTHDVSTTGTAAAQSGTAAAITPTPTLNFTAFNADDYKYSKIKIPVQ